MKVIELLMQGVRRAAAYHADVQVAPACVLWPDGEREWEAVVPMLQTVMPELLVLGEHDPAQRRGSALWLRCRMAGTLEGEAPIEGTPVLYLPGVSRQDLRAVDDCPRRLLPLAELQYRGVFWSQASTRDWTITAFLKSDRGGLSLDVAQGDATRAALVAALPMLLELPIDRLRGQRIDATFLNGLVVGSDLDRDLLEWIAQGDGFWASRTAQHRTSFNALCAKTYGLHPDRDGHLAAAARLAGREGVWQGVWDRYCEAPLRHAGIATVLRRCTPPHGDLLWQASDGPHDGWPQWNDEQEQELARSLLALAPLGAADAAARIIALEQRHGRRRTLVWAELGEAPLARALEHLAVIAEVSLQGVGAATLDVFTAQYLGSGLRADDALVRALAAVKPSQVAPVEAALRAVYVPWAEASAAVLRQLVERGGYSTTAPGAAAPSPHEFQDTCILFVDALRMDLGMRLAKRLRAAGCAVGEGMRWAALPSVTATAKPAVSPVAHRLAGGEVAVEFEPCVAETGQRLRGGYHFRRLLAEEGWTVVESVDQARAADAARGWCETGVIDVEGHARGWRLALQVDALVDEVRDRVLALLDAGWMRVRVVTDHGWLLLPTGLPAQKMPAVLAEHQWGRCAVLKEGASWQGFLHPWFWNAAAHVVLAEGIACFRQGVEYAHGGLTVQECLMPDLVVEREAGAAGGAGFASVAWKGLRCNVVVTGAPAGARVDLRRAANDAHSSVVDRDREPRASGEAVLFVYDEDLEGVSAVLVLVDAAGALLAQVETVIGGSEQ